VVKDEKGKPAVGVTVRAKGSTKITTTNENGEFTLNGVDANATLVFSAVNLQTFELKIYGKNELTVSLKTKVTELDMVEVGYSTGYQNIPKERATGSFNQVDNKLFNRSVSTNVLDRLRGVVSGVIFNSAATGGSLGKSPITIRGISTINANSYPLVVVDGFPYDESTNFTDVLNNINPNDVEGITVLKDAAAASIWGARAGNGVIVITTKKED